jgi:hypothetical protein
MKKTFFEFNCPWKTEDRYKNLKSFSWSNTYTKDIDGVFFFDDAISDGLDIDIDTRKYGWLAESRSITPAIIKKIKNDPSYFIEKYDLIFTHEKEICKIHEKFKFVQNPSAVTWVRQPKIYNKTKLISMISSTKNFCQGHQYRLDWVSKLQKDLDLYGRGFREISYKEEALRDYMFSIVIENDSYETYFTEKILDCFACGTIPIYHGSPDISTFFNKDGIIILKDNFSIKDLNQDLYYSKIEAIKDNFNKISNIIYPEDELFEKYLKE